MITRRLKASLAATPVVIVSLALVGPAPAGAPQPVKDGRYSGGSTNFFVFFDVKDRTAGVARVHAPELEACTGFGGPGVFDNDLIDDRGKFKLVDNTTHADNDFTVKGRFVGKARIKGRVIWETADPCPAGTYKFNYAMRRHAKVP